MKTINNKKIIVFFNSCVVIVFRLLLLCVDVCNLETAGKYCTLPRSMDNIAGLIKRRPLSMTGELKKFYYLDVSFIELPLSIHKLTIL